MGILGTYALLRNDSRESIRGILGYNAHRASPPHAYMSVTIIRATTHVDDPPSDVGRNSKPTDRNTSSTKGANESTYIRGVDSP